MTRSRLQRGGAVPRARRRTRDSAMRASLAGKTPLRTRRRFPVAREGRLERDEPLAIAAWRGLPRVLAAGRVTAPARGRWPVNRRCAPAGVFPGRAKREAERNEPLAIDSVAV